MIELSVGPILLSRNTEVALYQPNSGLTGTSYAGVQIAEYLREKMEDDNVSFVSVGGKLGGEEHKRNASISSLEEFHATSEIVIAPTETLGELRNSQLTGSKVIAICQHPRDAELRKVRKNLKPWLEVHVSRYSFWQNFTFTRTACFVPNPLWLGGTIRDSSFSSGPPLIGFVGSLVPEKGFLHLAKQWGEIRRQIPGAHLEVMGGASLYGEEEAHHLFPTSVDYGNKLLLAFGSDDLEALGVKFLGRVDEGKQKIARRWDLAICNPTGWTESFCYSVRESMGAGIPTFFGAHEGLSDIASKFPELGVKKPSDLPGKISAFWASPDLQEKIRVRMAAAADSDLAELHVRLEALIRMVRTVHDGRRWQLRVRAFASWPRLSSAGTLELANQWLTDQRVRLKLFSDVAYRYFKNDPHLPSSASSGK